MSAHGGRGMGGGGGGRGLGPGSRARRSAMGRRACREGHARAQPARPAAAVGALSPARERDVDGARARHGRLAGAAAAGEGRDRRRHRTPRHPHARAGRDRVPRLGAARVGDDLRADLSRRLGRPARARGPAHPHLHPPAEPADRLLREPPGGGADLAHDQRRRGAGKPRDGLGRDAVPGRPHARRGGRGAAVPRRASWRC